MSISIVNIFQEKLFMFAICYFNFPEGWKPGNFSHNPNQGRIWRTRKILISLFLVKFLNSMMELHVNFHV